MSFGPPTRPQRFILPRNFQRRYRRHLSHSKPLFQITRARRSLNQSSRLRIHSVQEFQIIRMQSGRICLKLISSHFTIASHKEDFKDGDKSFPSLARFLDLAKARIVPDDPSLVLPFGYIFIREKLQNFARVYTRNNTHRDTKSFTKTRASSWSLFLSLPFVPKKAFCLSAFLSISRVYKVNNRLVVSFNLTSVVE